MKTKKNPEKKKKKKIKMELIFNEGVVSSPWYYSEMAPVLCALCGKDCLPGQGCVNINPYCG